MSLDDSWCKSEGCVSWAGDLGIRKAWERFGLLQGWDSTALLENGHLENERFCSGSRCHCQGEVILPLNHSAHSTEFQTAQWMKWMVSVLTVFLSRGETTGFFQVYLCLEIFGLIRGKWTCYSFQRERVRTEDFAHGGLRLPGSVGKSWVGCCWAVLSPCWAEREDKTLLWAVLLFRVSASPLQLLMNWLLTGPDPGVLHLCEAGSRDYIWNKL